MYEATQIKELTLRVEGLERDRDAWKETAIFEREAADAVRRRLTSVMHERNLLERERRALWHTVRDIGDNGGGVGELLDRLASIAAPLREDQGLLEPTDR